MGADRLPAAPFLCLIIACTAFYVKPLFLRSPIGVARERLCAEHGEERFTREAVGAAREILAGVVALRRRV